MNQKCDSSKVSLLSFLFICGGKSDTKRIFYTELKLRCRLKLLKLFHFCKRPQIRNSFCTEPENSELHSSVAQIHGYITFALRALRRRIHILISARSRIGVEIGFTLASLNDDEDTESGASEKACLAVSFWRSFHTLAISRLYRIFDSLLQQALVGIW